MLTRLACASVCAGTTLALILGATTTARSAPTGSEEPSTVSDQAPDQARIASDQARPKSEAARRRARKRARQLRVRVKHPAGARKLIKVVVKGPKQRRGQKRFKKRFRKTKTFKRLRPGVYRIKAKTINFLDQRVKPKVVRNKVRIRKRTRRKVSRVRYVRPTFCARTGSTLMGWGDNQFGQLGSTGGLDSPRPVANPWLRGAVRTTGGLRTSYALCRDGSVWSWGFNGNGELGNGTTGDRTWPVRVKGLTNVVEIAANDEAAYALRSDGSVWAWGSGRYGQLGDGTTGFGRISRTPVRVRLPGPAATMAAGGNTAYAALRGSGQVQVWGNGGVGQRGNATYGQSTPLPVTAIGITDVTELAAGHVTVYARTSSGALRAWGGNNQAEVDPTQPSTVSLPYGIAGGGIGPVIGASHSAGYVRAGGSLWSWGSGRHHDIGWDNAGNWARISEVAALTGLPAREFAGAGYGAYLLLDNGSVWAWGDNSQGQVGTGAPVTGPSSASGLLPGVIPGLQGVTAIGAGVVNGYAVR